jgi:hypothetical protein
MVGLNSRIYFITGQFFNPRQLIIENIKKKVLKNSASPLNTLIFYSKEINIKELEEKILTFSFNKEKIIIVKEAHSLAKDFKDFFLANLKKVLAHNYFIFETDRDYAEFIRDRKLSSDTFFKFILQNATSPLKYQKAPFTSRVSFADLCRSVNKRDASSALYILEKLFESRNSEREKEMLGLQILGFLVQECSHSKNSLLKQKYFDYLWQADRLIKEKGLEPRWALEILLTKLTGANFI